MPTLPNLIREVAASYGAATCLVADGTRIPRLVTQQLYCLADERRRPIAEVVTASWLK